MPGVNGELVDHYWARVEMLALEAESGEFVSSELKQIVDDAVEAFSNSGQFDALMATFVGDLFAARDAYREQRPAFASIFARAAMLASNAVEVA